MKMNTYVNFAGKCAEACRYYEKHLGAKIGMMMTHGQGPDAGRWSPEWKEAVLHARIHIAGTELMAADIPNAEPMRSAYLSLGMDSDSEAKRVFAALSDGTSRIRYKGWPGSDADAGDLLCLAFWPGSGSVRNQLDDRARTAAGSFLESLSSDSAFLAGVIGPPRLLEPQTNFSISRGKLPIHLLCCSGRFEQELEGLSFHQSLEYHEAFTPVCLHPHRPFGVWEALMSECNLARSLALGREAHVPPSRSAPNSPAEK